MRRHPLHHRLLASLLAVLIAAPPGAALGYEAQTPIESYLFADGSAQAPAQALSAGAANGLRSRTAPVSSDGSFSWSHPLQLPPGRRGMTPSLALQYASSAARRASPAGAGWSFELPRIERSTLHGFPELESGATGPNALPGDDPLRFSVAGFTAPAGEIVPAAGVDPLIAGPAGAGGTFYVPLRELEPVRYEYLEGEDRWVEHLPNGNKRFFGSTSGGGSIARISGALGTFSWLLVREIDPFGNSIDYEYHYSSSTAAVRPVPIVSSVRWGGNSALGEPHLFEARVLIEPIGRGYVDLLHGSVRLTSRIDKIEVRAMSASLYVTPATPIYWSYDLNYSTSRDTGRDLLTSIIRSAPNEQSITTTYTYSSNDSLAPAGSNWFGPIQQLPPALASVYADTRYFQRDPSWNAWETRQATLSPGGLRSAHKLLDFDADGDVDILYHPAGVLAGTAIIRFEDSYFQQSGSWSAQSAAKYAARVSGIPTRNEITSIGDLDGDLDPDVIGFPFTLTRMIHDVEEESSEYSDNASFERLTTRGPVGPNGTPLACSLESMCGACGAGLIGGECHADPVGPYYVNEGPFYGPEGGHPFAEPSSVPFPHVPCNCVSICSDRSCEEYTDGYQALIEPPDADDPEAQASPKAWIALNTSQPSYLPAPAPQVDIDRRVVLRHWPPGVRERVELNFSDPDTAQHDMASTFQAPLMDIDADGKADLVLTKYLGFAYPTMRLPLVTFAPRTYLSRGWHFTSDWKGPFSNHEQPIAAQFTTSLIENLAPGVPNGCTEEIECIRQTWTHPQHVSGSGCGTGAFATCMFGARYPLGIDFNSFFLDVNGDNLPDLIAANPPTGNFSQRTCVDGHRVYLNRGYRWEVWNQPSERLIPDEYWSSLTTSAQPDSSPLLLLKNRARPCITQNGSFVPEAPSKENVPRGAMATVDINADGLTDLVFAYHATHIDGTSWVRHLFLNTGTGFVAAGPSFGANFAQGILPSDFALTAIAKIRFTSAYRRYSEVYSDIGRFEDLDGDGLVDLLYPGNCVQPAPGAEPNCTPPKWRRNLSTRPDYLVQITSPGGAWTAAHYLAAASDEARALGVVTSSVVPPGLVVVDRVERAAGPLSEGHSKETINFRYSNYLRARETSEAIGFEETTTTFQNRRGAQLLETFTLRTRQDTSSHPNTTRGASVVPFPKKGLPVFIHEQSGNTTRYKQITHRLEPLGSGVRVRQKAEESWECIAADCTSVATEISDFDHFGFARREEAGVKNGSNFSLPASIQRDIAFDHSTSLWQLGRIASDQVFGYRQDINGQGVNRALLAFSTNQYIGAELRRSTREDITPASCSSQGLSSHATVTYTYNLRGQLTKADYNQRRILNYSYDSHNLRLSTQSVLTGKYLDGQTIGTTLLVETFEHDPRTGKTTASVDPAGNRVETDYDSFGRPIQARGPGDVLLSVHNYVDTAPARVTSTIYRAPGVGYQTREHLDGEGRTIALIEADGSSFIRRSMILRDAFGRELEKYLPRFVNHLDDLAAQSGELVVFESFDGFDRILSRLQPDGSGTTWTYGPWSETRVDQRYFSSRRTFNWRGALVKTEHFSGAAPSPAGLIAQYSFVRDGLGRLNGVLDADGKIRQIERDLAGRPYRIDAPHTSGVSVPSFTLCHDLDDQPSSITSPSGRTTTVVRDQLARPIHVRSASALGIIESFASYDLEPTSIGRVSRRTDRSGDVDQTYDSFGRIDEVQFTPSSVARDGVTSLADSYLANFDYDFAGAVSGIELRSETAGSPQPLAALYYPRDARGRALRLESDSGGAIDILADNLTYDAFERMRAADLGNGLLAAWDYDPVRQYLTDITYSSSGNIFASYSATDIDPAGNIRAEIRHAEGSVLPVTEKIHTYDALGRLATSLVRQPYGQNSETYTYSPAGNLTAAGNKTYEYNTAGLSQAASRVYTAAGENRVLQYDADGWLSSDSSYDPVAKTDTTRTLTFDAAGCLLNVRTLRAPAAGGAPTIDQETRHVCGDGGSRVFRRTENRLTGAVSRVINFGGLAEIRPDDGVFLLRLRINDTAVVEDARDLSTGDRVLDQSRYVFTDPRGSILARAELGGSPILAEEAEYDAWGNTIAISTLDHPRHRFVGQEPDPVDGYYHFGRRVYDPTLRRWLSPDPLLFALPELDLHEGEQLNLYSYAANNPVGRTDPTGTIAPLTYVLAAAALVYLGNDVKANISKVPIIGNISSGVQQSLASMKEINALPKDDPVAAFKQGAKIGFGIAVAAIVLSEVGQKEPDPVAAPPNPNGKKGSAEHQAEIERVAEDIERRGLEPRKEYPIATPGGEKKKRFVDVVGVDPQTREVKERHQVGKQNKDGTPVARERRAIKDIENAPAGGPVVFHPYNKND